MLAVGKVGDGGLGGNLSKRDGEGVVALEIGYLYLGIFAKTTPHTLTKEGDCGVISRVICIEPYLVFEIAGGYQLVTIGLVYIGVHIDKAIVGITVVVIEPDKIIVDRPRDRAAP